MSSPARTGTHAPPGPPHLGRVLRLLDAAGSITLAGTCHPLRGKADIGKEMKCPHEATVPLIGASVNVFFSPAKRKAPSPHPRIPPRFTFGSDALNPCRPVSLAGRPARAVTRP